MDDPAWLLWQPSLQMTHRLLCLLMHGRTNQPTANPCVLLTAPQVLLLSQRISFPISSPSQHILGHCLGTYLLNRTNLATTLSETSCPWVLLALPSTGTRLQLCPAVLQHPTGGARHHPFWNFFLHCLPSNHTPFHILSFLPSRKALPVRGELFCCFPAGKLHVGTSYPQPQPVEFKQAPFLINFILKRDSRVLTVKRTPLFLHLERNSCFLRAEPARQGGI